MLFYVKFFEMSESLKKIIIKVKYKFADKASNWT